jgi:hypothetical protein
MEFNVIKTVIAIYPGRFQPFGKHHAETFKWLQSKFGTNDTFIATSDNVKLPNSPLNFKEKQAIISKYGFGNNLIQVKNPYKAEEITSKYDPKTTAVVFMVGKKDMQEDPRFVIGKKKDGGDSYFQKYDPNKPMKSYLQHGYLVVAPHKSYDIPGIGEMSGTNIRVALSSPTTAAQYKKNFEGIFGWWDEKLANLMKQKFSNQPLKETTILSSLFKALLKEGGAGGDYVTCEICKASVKAIAPRHLKCKHNITLLEYKQLYPNAETISENLKIEFSNNNVFKDNKVKEKIKETKLQKYGSENYNNSKGYKSSITLKELINSIKESEVNTKILLLCGGAGGHMAHPFDLDKVKSGNDLVKVFDQTAKFLVKNPAPVKIDGVNASIRLGDIDGKRQFVIDRGSSKELDIKGVTKADLPTRFNIPGHGMIKVGGKVLDIFNKAIPVIKGDLAKLGMIKNPNILFNIEYVEGKTNVQDYGKNFLAIHNLLEIGQTPGKKSRSTHEIPYSKDVLEDLIENLQPIAKKYGFEVLSSIPAKIEKTPNFGAALSKSYTVVIDKKNKQTKSLKEWLNDAKNTKGLKLKLKDGKTVDALSKQVFLAVKKGTPLEDLVADPKDQKVAIDSFVIYEATMELGDALLKSMTSPLGPVDQQEGIVVRDPSIDSEPFKITGSFIVRGLETSFTR